MSPFDVIGPIVAFGVTWNPHELLHLEWDILRLQWESLRTMNGPVATIYRRSLQRSGRNGQMPRVGNNANSLPKFCILCVLCVFMCLSPQIGGWSSNVQRHLCPGNNQRPYIVPPGPHYGTFGKTSKNDPLWSKIDIWIGISSRTEKYQKFQKS